MFQESGSQQGVTSSEESPPVEANRTEEKADYECKGNPCPEDASTPASPQGRFFGFTLVHRALSYLPGFSRS